MKIHKWMETWDYHKDINWLITDDEKPIANGSLEIGKSYISLKGGYVQPEYRGKGYGKILLDIRIKEYKELDTV